MSEWYFTVHGTKHVYWGVERMWSESNRKRVRLQWMQEMEKPYRVGRALRVRIGRRAFHIGLCRLSERPPGRELPDVGLDEIINDYEGVGGHEIWES